MDIEEKLKEYLKEGQDLDLHAFVDFARENHISLHKIELLRTLHTSFWETKERLERFKEKWVAIQMSGKDPHVGEPFTAGAFQDLWDVFGDIVGRLIANVELQLQDVRNQCPGNPDVQTMKRHYACLIRCLGSIGGGSRNPLNIEHAIQYATELTAITQRLRNEEHKVA